MINKVFGKKSAQFYFNIFMAGFIIAIFLSSFNLRTRATRLPILIGSITLLFIVIDCIIMAVAERREEIRFIPEAKIKAQKIKVPIKKILISLCFMVMTVIVWQLLGFIVTSILITVVFGIFLGSKNKRNLIISATILTLILYWVFGVFLGVPLPRGLLF